MTKSDTVKGILYALAHTFILACITIAIYWWIIYSAASQKDLLITNTLTGILLLLTGIGLEFGRVATILTTFSSKKVLTWCIVAIDFLQSYLILLFSILVLLVFLSFINLQYPLQKALLIMFSLAFLLSILIYYLLVNFDFPRKIINMTQNKKTPKFFRITFKEEIDYALEDIQDRPIKKTTEFLVILMTIFAIINSTLTTQLVNPSEIEKNIDSLLSSFDMQFLLVTLALYIQYAHQKLPWLERNSAYTNSNSQDS